jgi:hypothetical protein
MEGIRSNRLLILPFPILFRISGRVIVVAEKVRSNDMGALSNTSTDISSVGMESVGRVWEWRKEKGERRREKRRMEKAMFRLSSVLKGRKRNL